MLLRQRSSGSANLIKSSSSRVAKNDIDRGLSRLYKRSKLVGRKRKTRLLQLLLLLVSLSLYLIWFRLNNEIQHRYTRGGARNGKLRHFQQASNIDKGHTLMQKAASGLVRIGSISTKKLSRTLTAEKLAHAHLSVHQRAGSDCEVTWIKTGKPCQLVTNIIPPLDLLWTWQNTSDFPYVKTRQAVLAEYDTNSTESTSPGSDTLTYSLRSAQRYLKIGFGSIALLTSDLEDHSVKERASIATDDRAKTHRSLAMLGNLQSLLGHRHLLRKHAKISKIVESKSESKDHHHPSIRARKHRTQVQESISARAEFSDEVGGKRFAQIPAWLESESRHEAFTVIDMWSTACRSDLTIARSAFQQEEGDDQSRDFKATTLGGKWGSSLVRYVGLSHISRLHRWIKKQSKSKVSSVDSAWTLVAGYACKQSRLPTFNPSVTRMIAADYESQGGVFVLLDKHHFFAQPVSSADFYSPLHGPVFRLSSNGVGEGVNALAQEKDSASLAQITANTLLSARFGHRDRSRLMDLPLVIVKNLMTEVQQVWQDQLMDASLHRFAAPGDIDLAFLYTHYTIERHREMLLWSFFVARHDVNGDNKYSHKEVIHLLDDLGLDTNTIPNKGESVSVHFPIQPRYVNNTRYKRSHTEAGLIEPMVDDVSFTSQQGHSSARDTRLEDTIRATGSLPALPHNKTRVACKLSHVCFKPLFKKPEEGPMRPTDLFKHMAFNHWGCGDCVIQSLLSKESSVGNLAAFLPASDLRFPPVAARLSQLSAQPVLASGPRFESLEYSLDRTAQGTNHGSMSRLGFVSQNLVRYQYALADTDEDHCIVHFVDDGQARSRLIDLELSPEPMISMVNRSRKSRKHLDATMISWLKNQYADSYL